MLNVVNGTIWGFLQPGAASIVHTSTVRRAFGGSARRLLALGGIVPTKRVLAVQRPLLAFDAIVDLLLLYSGVPLHRQTMLSLMADVGNWPN